MFTTTVYSQGTISVNITADIVNQFVNRGQNSGGNSFQLQPLVYADFKNFEFGAWGSYGVTNNYQEIDLYVKYFIKNFAIQYMHYNMPSTQDFSKNALFSGDYSLNFDEISVYYNGNKDLPIKLMSATYICGDKQFSTYMEAAYEFKNGNQHFNFFVGGTPRNGLYGNAGITNIGLTVCNPIKLIDYFSLPTYITLCGNPDTKIVYFVFGVTL